MIVDPVASISGFSRRLLDIKRSRQECSDELQGIEKSLEEFLGSINTVHERLKDIKMNPDTHHAKATPAQGLSADDFKGLLEKILQGSLETVGDKISERIINMIRDLKGLAGAAREDKILQIKEVVDSQMVDLSSLYTHEDVQSNLGEVGVEEKESKGIESSLERLRELRGKTKTAGTSEN